MQPLLEVLNISHAFDRSKKPDLQVLSSISFKLKPGEILCVLGTSGCGKTTLLNILTGLIEPIEGEVKAEIKRPSGDVGYMTQENPLLPWRNVYQNVALGLEFHGFSKKNIQQRVDKYLDVVNLSEFKEDYPRALSGGMKQRVALARTLALEPKLLCMDEPLSNLDIPQRQRLARMIRDYVRKKQAGVIVVTHSVEEAVFLADKVLLLTSRPATIAQSFKGSKNISFDTIMKAFFEMSPKEGHHAA